MKNSIKFSIPNSKKSVLLCATNMVLLSLLVNLFAKFQICSTDLILLIISYSATFLFIFFYFPFRKDWKTYLDWWPIVIALFLALSTYGFWGPIPVRYRLILVFCLFYLLFRSLKNFFYHFHYSTPDYDQKFLFRVVFITTALCLLCVWMNHFPYSTSPDTVSQWQQIHHEIPFTTITPVGYMLVLQGLLGIIDNYVIVILVQVVLVSWLFASFAKFLYTKNISGVFFVTLPIFLLNCSCTEAIFYPWKDVPYSLCIGAVTLLLMKLLEKDASIKSGGSILLGVGIAAISLFRHNGIVITAFFLIVFSILFFKKKLMKQLGILVLSALVCWGGCTAYSNYVLKPVDGIKGAGFWPMLSGIAAAVAESPTITEEQLVEVESVYSIDFMKENYNVYLVDGLLQDGLCEGDRDIYYCVGKYSSETIRQYFDLLPNNFPTMLKDLAFNTEVVIGLVDYFFMNQNIFFFSVLLFLFGLLVIAKKHWDYLLVISPVILNAMTVFVSAISYEKRYVLVTFLLFPFLVAYAAKTVREDKFQQISK